VSMDLSGFALLTLEVCDMLITNQFSSSTTKLKVSLVLLGEPSGKFSIEHSDFLFLGDQSFGELTCWVASQGATTLSI